MHRQLHFDSTDTSMGMSQLSVRVRDYEELDMTQLLKLCDVVLRILPSQLLSDKKPPFSIWERKQQTSTPT